MKIALWTTLESPKLKRAVPNCRKCKHSKHQKEQNLDADLPLFSWPLAMLSAISDGSSSSRRYWWHRSVANPPNQHGSSRSSTRLRRSLEHSEPRCRPLLGSCPNDHAYATTDDPKWSNLVQCASSTPSMLCAQNGCAFGTCLSCENGHLFGNSEMLPALTPPRQPGKTRYMEAQYASICPRKTAASRPEIENFALAVGYLQTFTSKTLKRLGEGRRVIWWHGDMQINLMHIRYCPQMSPIGAANRVCTYLCGVFGCVFVRLLCEMRRRAPVPARPTASEAAWPRCRFGAPPPWPLKCLRSAAKSRVAGAPHPVKWSSQRKFYPNLERKNSLGASVACSLPNKLPDSSCHSPLAVFWPRVKGIPTQTNDPAEVAVAHQNKLILSHPGPTTRSDG